MGGIYAFADIVPVIDPSAFVHPDATVIGDVIIGPGVFIAPGASLRGDMGRLIVEAGANVQDNCVMHGFPGRDCVVEADGHIGHGAVLHGCRVGRNALVGMSAVMMDGAEIGESAFVAAMAFVKAASPCRPRSWSPASPPASCARSSRTRSPGRAPARPNTRTWCRSTVTGSPLRAAAGARAGSAAADRCHGHPA